MPKATSKPSGLSTATTTSDIGAPSQYAQSGRKSKKSWRKNIDIGSVESALDNARDQERRTGVKMGQEASDDVLFKVDTKGDESIAVDLKKYGVRRTFAGTPVGEKKKKELRSLAVLKERSAVPALFARPVTSVKYDKEKMVSSADKERLLRIARKKTIGSDGQGMGSAVIVTKAKSGEVVSDIWGELADSMITNEIVEEEVDNPWIEKKRAVKPPITLERQRARAVQLSHSKALPIPAAGISYNPKLEEYSTLMAKALAEEQEKLAHEAEEEIKFELARARAVVINPSKGMAPGEYTGYPMGMEVGDGEDESEEENEQEGEERIVKPTRRKTQAEKNKRERFKEEERRRLAITRAKALTQSLHGLTKTKKEVESSLRTREAAVAARRARRLALQTDEIEAGRKIGKHRVKKQDVEVQLEEDLTENLRELKPEGNLFRDRFMSLQQRALVEPRERLLPKKRKIRMKQYEKHPWKKFE